MKIKLSLLLFLMCAIFTSNFAYAQDFDNDGVADLIDQDKDNDGILNLEDGAICFTEPRLLDNSVATASAFGSGQAGIPALSYEVPSGVHRLMLVIITVERDHTVFPYGDNWESDWPLTGDTADRQIISYGGVPMELDRLRYTYTYVVGPNDPPPNIAANAEHSATTYVYKMFEDALPDGTNDFDFTEFNLPINDGDEFSVIVSASFKGKNSATLTFSISRRQLTSSLTSFAQLWQFSSTRTLVASAKTTNVSAKHGTRHLQPIHKLH